MPAAGDAPGRAAQRASRRVARASALAIALAITALALAPRAVAQELAGEGVEGPLANDTFLPLSQPAAVELRAGDLALAAARAGGPEAERELARAFEAWRAALDEAAPGELVPASALTEAGDAPAPRCAEDPSEALARRLARLSEAERRAWRERFEALGARALGQAREPAELALVLAAHPGTQAAARAALSLADRALEEGRPSRAAGWLARASEAARLADLDAGWREPLARRRALLESLRPPAQPPEPWRKADALEEVRWLAFPSVRGTPSARPSSGERLGRRLRPGGVRLSDGSLAAQTVDRLFVLDPQGGLVALSIGSLLESLGWPYLTPFGDGEGDWPLLPASDGELLVVVAGRATAGGGNALLCLRPPVLGRAAELRWALSSVGEVHPTPSEEARELPELFGSARAAPAPPERELEEGQWDFQPGALVVGELVLVQARLWPGGSAGRRGEARAQTHLLALELATGRVRWRRFLGLGADRAEDPAGALALRRSFDAPAQPLVRVGERVFAPTGLGLGALVELVDGQVRWVWRVRRHEPGGQGWESARGPLVLAATPALPAQLVWGPNDSDHLYRLEARPAQADPLELLVAAPSPLGSALELYGASREAELVLARSGARLALARRETAGAALDLLLLGREERPLGAALGSAERLLVATDRGLLVLDRTRDLFLLQQLAPPADAQLTGASLLAEGASVWVVAGSGVWELAVRP